MYQIPPPVCNDLADPPPNHNVFFADIDIFADPRCPRDLADSPPGHNTSPADIIATHIDGSVDSSPSDNVSFVGTFAVQSNLADCPPSHNVSLSNIFTGSSCPCDLVGPPPGYNVSPADSFITSHWPCGLANLPRHNASLTDTLAASPNIAYPFGYLAGTNSTIRATPTGSRSTLRRYPCHLEPATPFLHSPNLPFKCMPPSRNEIRWTPPLRPTSAVTLQNEHLTRSTIWPTSVHPQAAVTSATSRA